MHAQCTQCQLCNLNSMFLFIINKCHNALCLKQMKGWLLIMQYYLLLILLKKKKSKIYLYLFICSIHLLIILFFTFFSAVSFNSSEQYKSTWGEGVGVYIVL